MSKIEELKKEKFSKELREAEIYQDLISSYNNGISYDDIYNMYDLDYDIYMKKIRYGYNFIKQTCIKDEYDLDRVKTAFSFFFLKLKQQSKQCKEVKTYFDIVLDEKKEIEKTLQEGISLSDYASLIETDLELYYKSSLKKDDEVKEETVTKSRAEYNTRKLALELLKKENN